MSGHCLATVDIERFLTECEEVAEAAVIGKKHDVKGEAPVAFVILKDGFGGGPELVDQLKKNVCVKIGPVARPEDIIFTAALPRSRSGKVMRRVLKDIAEGRAPGDTNALSDSATIREIAGRYGKNK